MTTDRVLRSACRSAGNCLCCYCQPSGRRRRSRHTSTSAQASRSAQRRTSTSVRRRQQASTNRTVADRPNTSTAANQCTVRSNFGIPEGPTPLLLAPSQTWLPPPLPPPPHPRQQQRQEQPPLGQPTSERHESLGLNAVMCLVVVLALALMVFSGMTAGKNFGTVGPSVVRGMKIFGVLVFGTLRFGYQLLVDFVALYHWSPNRTTVMEPSDQKGAVSHTIKPNPVSLDSSREFSELRMAIKLLEVQLANVSQGIVQSQSLSHLVGTKQTVLDETAVTQRLMVAVEARLSELTEQELMKLSTALDRLLAEVAANRQMVEGSSVKAADASRMLTERIEQLQKELAALKQSQTQAMAVPVSQPLPLPTASATLEGDDLPDFALASTGARVISIRDTQAYFGTTSWWWQWWWGQSSLLHGPNIVLTPTVQPGTCYAFVGFPGRLVVKLSHPIHVSGVTIDHLSRQQSHSGSVDSAPREFVVRGLTSGCESSARAKKLGSFIFAAETGPPTQTFRLAEPTQQVYEYVELAILSNHGQLDYTCLYRFRVHGHMS